VIKSLWQGIWRKTLIGNQVGNEYFITDELGTGETLLFIIITTTTITTIIALPAYCDERQSVARTTLAGRVAKGR